MGSEDLDSWYQVRELRDHVPTEMNIFGPREGQSAEKKKKKIEQMRETEVKDHEVPENEGHGVQVSSCLGLW